MTGSPKATRRRVGALFLLLLILAGVWIGTAPPTDNHSTNVSAIERTRRAARDMFARLYQDIKEHREVRALSAAGLQFLDPARFVEVGKRIVADTNEYDDIRATTMNALSRFDDYRDVLHDSGFVERLKSIGADAQPGRLLDSVRRLLRRRDKDE